MQARDHFIVAEHLAVMQQGNGAGFGGGIQGQQRGHVGVLISGGQAGKGGDFNPASRLFGGIIRHTETPTARKRAVG